MQTITFAKGNEQHLKACKDALCQSTLGEKYFSSPGSAEKVILEGIRQGNLYVALIGEACRGVYALPVVKSFNCKTIVKQALLQFSHNAWSLV